MKTLCIVACHTNSDMKIESLKQSRKFLEEITDDIIYINSIGCTSPFDMIHVKNTTNVCYEKYLHVLLKINLKEYDNFILTNDSIFIIHSLIEFKKLFDPSVEMSSLVCSNECKVHYPDFLRRYNRIGIQKLIQFYKKNLKNQSILQLIEDIELKCHTIHDSINVLYPAENDFYHNIHFDNRMLKKYVDKNYPILKIKKLIEYKYVSYPLFLLDYNKQLDCNFNIYDLTRTFEYTSYVSSYTDVNINLHNKSQYIQHWIKYGIREGRTYFFNWIKYLDTYPDLRQNGILTEQQAIDHWLHYGKQESRIYFI